MVVFFDYLFPVGILLFIFKAHKRLEDKDYEERVGSLFEGLKVKRVIYLMCTFFFLIRRLTLVLVSIVL